jgi:glycerol transport system substrate-binding protein
MVEPGLPVMNEDGTPKWRMAPSPHGVYWKEGQKVGYQDAGSWTLMKSTPVDRAKAAWLYAQFVTSKTVDLKKSDVGLTFIRESTINSDQLHRARADKLGGLIEFYRSPARVQWSPTGTNVPDYPKLAQLWWQNIGDRPGMSLEAQEKVMERLERAGVQESAKLNEPQDASSGWNSRAHRIQERMSPQTVSYDELSV